VLIHFIYATSLHVRSLRPIRVPSDRNTRWWLSFPLSTDKGQEIFVFFNSRFPNSIMDASPQHRTCAIISFIFHTNSFCYKCFCIRSFVWIFFFGIYYFLSLYIILDCTTNMNHWKYMNEEIVCVKIYIYIYIVQALIRYFWIYS
jgi:hypothetical protein